MLHHLSIWWFARGDGCVARTLEQALNVHLSWCVYLVMPIGQHPGQLQFGVVRPPSPKSVGSLLHFCPVSQTETRNI